MDIRNWQLDRIMQLPMCCFGRRYVVEASLRETTNNQAWAMSELSLPERGVVWSFCAGEAVGGGYTQYLRVSVGEKVPTSEAEMTALAIFLPGLGYKYDGQWRIDVGRYADRVLYPLKQIIEPPARHLILELTGTAAQLKAGFAAAIVSSIPEEVPDWLCSGLVKSL